MLKDGNDLSIEEFEKLLPEIRNFLLNNLDVFKKPIKVRHNDWPKILEDLESQGFKTDPFYGKCCPVAHFLLFLMGGKKANKLELQMTKPRVFVTLPDGRQLRTTHWWVRDVKTKKIYDLTGSQFIYGVPVEEFYPYGMKADVGYPYFKKGPKKSPHFEENVPTKDVLELGRRFKYQFDTAYGLNSWIEYYDNVL